MRKRLPNCDRWHPGVASDWSDYQRKRNGVVVGIRRICLECNRARCRAHHNNSPPPPIEEPVIVHNYGVLPRLNWTPPSI